MQSFAIVLAAAGIVAAQTTLPAAPPVNVQSCKSNHDICVSAGTQTAATCDSQLQTCEAGCGTKYDSCRVGPNANMAQCGSDYATCLGRNPFDNNGNVVGGVAGGNNAGAGAANSNATTTATVLEVVQSFTMTCPYATTVWNNGQAYVATGPTVLTITNCPCTVTKSLTTVPTSPASNYGSGSGSGSGSGNGSGSSNGTTSHTPVPYTGAANKMVGAGLCIVAAGAGALAFFL